MALALALTLVGYAALLGIVFSVFSETGAFIVCTLLGVFLVVSIRQADRIAYLATKAVAVEREKYPTLYDTVERLAGQADLSTPPVAVIASDEPNALSAGTGDRTVICLTTGLLEVLEEDELEAVLAHELAHLKNNDSSVMTVAGFPTIVSGLLFSAARRTLTPGSFLLGWPFMVGVYLLFVGVPIYVASLPGTLVLSRYREYAADRGAVAITGDPYALASALATLHDQPSPPNEDLRQVASFNAFCIVPTETLFPILTTHPPVADRIRNLRELVETTA
jgi:heat shock protein HtpX